ncbi:MAG: hypothetical protein CO094_07785 [Anaerolineae bacterium CG_4_9_14_3_um_filter_57_17]|nr:hypothetical protein [bacterium]NCT19677.1 hypothetical protein [bacterium]OIO83473.1 MAG: hypothetical protein AUK01_12495 [Anaerolineae bacterium CG2_30_57_67]PJB66193.1 MAG: hypothetical protein CO094_07785 [Anaerolineae bacterium CG_4_9_14_3_um_filter_57_17]
MEKHPGRPKKSIKVVLTVEKLFLSDEKKYAWINGINLLARLLLDDMAETSSEDSQAINKGDDAQAKTENR